MQDTSPPSGEGRAGRRDLANEHQATAMLQAMKRLGPRRGWRLLECFGSAVKALDARDSAWSEALGWPTAAVRAARRSVSASAVRADLRRLRRMGGRIVAVRDPEYPVGWQGMIDPPLLIRCVGSARCLVGRPVVAIVGARRCSAIGLDLAARFATAFAEAGWTVCSGGARGIDAAAHRACLRVGGSTVAVLGSGLAHMYPPEHRDLFGEISERGGAVISELPVQAGPRPSHFPVRNRLVAGLSVGVLLVEAGDRSGALITGRLAAEDYGREVVAIPGRVDTRSSAGCHRAIREGWAVLVDEPGQAIEQMESQGGLIRLQQASKGGAA